MHITTLVITTTILILESDVAIYQVIELIIAQPMPMMYPLSKHCPLSVLMVTSNLVMVIGRKGFCKGNKCMAFRHPGSETQVVLVQLANSWDIAPSMPLLTSPILLDLMCHSI